MYNHVCTFIVFIIFGSAMSAPTEADKFQADMECVAQAKIQGREPLNMETLRMGNEYDKEIACYNVCVEKKHGLINDDGTFNIDAAAKIFDSNISEEKYREIYNKCNEKSVVGDPCRTLYDASHCVTKLRNEAISKTAFASLLDPYRMDWN